MSRKILKKAMELHGISREQISKVISLKGSIKDWLDVKILLDTGTDLEEIEKQCIINRCHRLLKISLLF